MSEKKVLLELRGVKTFFPVRGGFFNKVRDHVQAVNDVDWTSTRGRLWLVGSPAAVRPHWQIHHPTGQGY